jgi:hypothetical protein
MARSITKPAPTGMNVCFEEIAKSFATAWSGGREQLCYAGVVADAASRPEEASRRLGPNFYPHAHLEP